MQTDHSSAAKPTTEKTVIATRGSMLALWQANYVKDLIESKTELQAEIKVVSTQGDRVQNRFLHEMGGKGVFVKEIQQQIIAEQADIAVHSLKDLPAEIPEETALAACIKRHPAGDTILIHKKVASSILANSTNILKASDMHKLAKLRIGTGSLRRKALLLEANPDLRITPIRGNIDTRLKKLAAGEWDAIILASASLHRSGLGANFATYELDPEWFVPSPSQGVIAVETRKGHPCFHLFKRLNHQESENAVAIERGILKGLGADCTLPVGAHAVLKEGMWMVAAVVGHAGKSARASLSFPAANASVELIVEAILNELRRAHVNDVLQALDLETI